MKFLHGEWHASQRHSNIPSACSNLFCQGSSFLYESPTTEQKLMNKWKGYLITMKFINGHWQHQSSQTSSHILFSQHVLARFFVPLYIPHQLLEHRSKKIQARKMKGGF
jgi:hypothetical protein